MGSIYPVWLLSIFGHVNVALTAIVHGGLLQDSMRDKLNKLSSKWDFRKCYPLI